MLKLGYCGYAEINGGVNVKCRTCGHELELYDLLDYRCGNGCNDYPILLKIGIFLQLILLFIFLGLAMIILGLIIIGEKIGLVTLILKLKRGKN